MTVEISITQKTVKVKIAKTYIVQIGIQRNENMLKLECFNPDANRSIFIQKKAG